MLHCVAFRPIGDLKIPGKEEPALLVHNDYTDSSATLTSQYFAGDEAAELSNNSWALVNVCSLLHMLMMLCTIQARS